MTMSSKVMVMCKAGGITVGNKEGKKTAENPS